MDQQYRGNSGASFLATRDDPAPLFSAEAVSGKNEIARLSLGDYIGKWVILFFYPSNFTAV
ncbi:alkyl hydroperoxide reductase [Mesobacillus zeae]|uniref:Alkyl hydroperoxide reductase n=2 Tax=Mesobacillus zeae TaxID=1917180 RepID=A0A398B8Q0_9BACI|nr:alkyl hydroperoxide reductase [Mesobacillus zeae]